MSHYLQNKLNPRKHGFLKTKITATSLVINLNFSYSLFQHQVDSVYFDLSSVSDLVLRSVLLHNLCVHWHCDGYVGWLCSYLTN